MLVGVATAARTATAQAVPLVVAVIGIAVALFATVVGSTLEDGVAQAARRSVAADVAVTSVALDADQVDRIARLPGVAAAVGVSTSDEVVVRHRTWHGAGDRDRRATRPVSHGCSTASREHSRSRRRSATPTPTGSTWSPRVPSPTRPGATRACSARTPGSSRPRRTCRPSRRAGRWVLVDARNADAVTDTGSVDRVLGPDHRRCAVPTSVASAIRSAVPSGSVVTADGVQRSLDADPRLPGTRVVRPRGSGPGRCARRGCPRRRDRAGGGGAPRGGVRLLGGVRRRPANARGRRGGRDAPAPARVPRDGPGRGRYAVVATTLPAADLRSFTGGDVRPGVAVDPVLLAVVGIGVVLALAAVLAAAVRVGAPRTVHRDGRHDRRPRPRQTDPGRTR